MSAQDHQYSQKTEQNTDHHGKHSFLDKTKLGGKAAFDKGWGLFEKLGVPVNKLTNKIGSEAFWPSTLDHESDKCARIVKSFCSEYLVYTTSAPAETSQLTLKQRMDFIKSNPDPSAAVGALHRDRKRHPRSWSRSLRR